MLCLYQSRVKLCPYTSFVRGLTTTLPPSDQIVNGSERIVGTRSSGTAGVVEEEGHQLTDELKKKELEKAKEMEKEMKRLREGIEKAQKQTSQLRRALMDCEERRESDLRLHNEQQQRAGARLARDLLAIKDTLERISSKPSSDGINLVVRDLISRLRRHGVEPLPSERQSIGATFDPTIHNAITTVPIPRETVEAVGAAVADGGPVVERKTQHKPGTIAHVFKDGFTINGILLRPADVSVYM